MLDGNYFSQIQFSEMYDFVILGYFIWNDLREQRPVINTILAYTKQFIAAFVSF